jgi:hypothetical protein
MKVGSFVLIASALVWSASDLRGQVDSTLLGKRLRVRLQDLHRQAELTPPILELRGTLTVLGSDTLTIVLPSAGAAVAIPRSRITSLAVSAGVPSRLESAARSGFLWALLGGVSSYALHTTQDVDRSLQEQLLIGVTSGAAAGIIFGIATPFERWRRLRSR